MMADVVAEVKAALDVLHTYGGVEVCAVQGCYDMGDGEVRAVEVSWDQIRALVEEATALKRGAAILARLVDGMVDLWLAERRKEDGAFRAAENERLRLNLSACDACDGWGTMLKRDDEPVPCPDCDWTGWHIVKRLRDENERLKADLATMTQAVGLATTIKGDMEMRADDPIGMMQEVVAHAAADARKADTLDRLRAWAASEDSATAILLLAKMAELEAHDA